MKHIVIFLTAVVIAAALSGCGHDDVETMSYEPDFIDLVESDRVDRVTLVQHPSGLIHITGWTKPDTEPGIPFRVEVLDSIQSIAPFLRKSGVPVGIAVAEPKEQRSWNELFFAFREVFLIIVLVLALILALRLVRAMERIAKSLEDANRKP
jgi:hypothetical protein